jgi:hypothetical protein
VEAMSIRGLSKRVVSKFNITTCEQPTAAGKRILVESHVSHAGEPAGK